MFPKECFDIVKEFVFGIWFETNTVSGWKDSGGGLHGVITFVDECGIKKCFFEHGKFKYDIEIKNTEGQPIYQRDTVDGQVRIRRWYPTGVYKYQKIANLNEENYSETKWYPCGNIKSIETNTFLKRWYRNGIKRIEVYYNPDGTVITCTYWNQNGNQQDSFDEDAEHAEYFED